MADKRASLFTLVTTAYGTNYVPILVQLSPGTYANCRITVDDFVSAVVPPDDLALEAFNLAVTGTNAAAAAQSTATSAFSIAVIGTNAAATALSTANSAYTIAVAGTDAATVAQLTANNAFNLAASATIASGAASDLALAAYHLAQIGTNTGTAAYALAAAALPTSGGIVNGTLSVGANFFAESVLSVATTLAYAGTTVIDFNGPSALAINLPGDTQFATSNLTGANDGKMIKVALTATGTGTNPLNLGYPSWKVIGGSLASTLVNGKSAILSLELIRGTNDSNVWAVMASES
jgi:hypothetical protein